MIYTCVNCEIKVRKKDFLAHKCSRTFQILLENIQKDKDKEITELKLRLESQAEEIKLLTEKTNEIN